MSAIDTIRKYQIESEADATKAEKDAQDVDLREYADDATPYDPSFHLVAADKAPFDDDRLDALADKFGSICFADIDCDTLTEAQAEALLAAKWRWYGNDGHTGNCTDLKSAPLGSTALAGLLAREVKSWQIASEENWRGVAIEREAQAADNAAYLADRGC